MDIHCVRCSTAIAPADVNVQQVIAKCAACGAIFDFSSQTAGGPRPERIRAQVPLPARFVVTDAPAPTGGDPYRTPGVSRGDLTISWSWPRALGAAFLAFAAVWFSVLASGHVAPDAIAALFAIFGMVPSYVGLAMVLNRSTVRVSRDALEIDHQPIWWPGGARFAVADLTQLFVVQRIERHGTGNDGRTTVKFQLCAIDRAGMRRKLVALDDLDQALYLEQRIERHLGIVDVEVAGAITA